MTESEWNGPADPGLQPERTDLSWSRTAMAFALASAVLLRWAWVFGPVVLGLVALLFTVALAVHLTQRSRYRRYVAGMRGGRVPVNVRGVVLMSGSVVCYGLAATALILL